MENPRPEKVAVVDEVRERFSASSGALLTEYRGLTVAQMADPAALAARGRGRATRSTRTPSSASPPATSASSSTSS